MKRFVVLLAVIATLMLVGAGPALAGTLSVCTPNGMNVINDDGMSVGDDVSFIGLIHAEQNPSGVAKFEANLK